MNKKLLQLLVVSFIFRVILLIIDNFWFRLPQGGVDTQNFDKWAYNITINGHKSFLEIISNGVYFFSSYGALIYKFFGHHSILWSFSMMLFGVGTVYNIYKTILLITRSEKTALLAGWLIGIYPNLAVLSVLILRESPIHYFISLAMFFLAKYYLTNNRNYLFTFFISSIICTILHSGMFSILVGFIVATIFYNPNMNTSRKLSIIFLSIVGLFFINSTGIGLSKFGGSLENAVDIIDEGIGVREAAAMYPSWLVLTGGFGDFWKIPFRMIAFLFAPLIPPLAKSLNHSVGLFDAAFYLLLIYFIYKKRIMLKKYKIFGVYASVIIMVTFAYSLGSSNFGTNIRHRAKILPVIILTGAAAYRYRSTKVTILIEK